jgi:hypothetical protein
MQEVVFYNSDQSANREGIEDNINAHYGIYEFSGLLDDYSGAAAAYSLRRLSSTYTGPAIRVVKHDVGYPEMDIPFEDDGTLSVVLLEAFADGYDATVKVWYDQSGGSNDAEQSTLASQPKIVDAGTVIYENGLPALEFDGLNDRFPFDNSALDIGSLSSFTVGKYDDVLSSQVMLGLSGGVGNKRWYAPYLRDGDFNYGYGDAYNVMKTTADANQNLHTLIAGSTLGNAEAFLNSSSVGTYPLDSGIDTTNEGIMNLKNAFYSNGKLQEVIVYGSDQSANRTGIESNINDFYSIYP